MKLVMAAGCAPGEGRKLWIHPTANFTAFKPQKSFQISRSLF
jgi:hypothetical protein